MTPALVPIPGGCFLMGSDCGRPDESPVHVVDVAPFLLSRTPIRRLEYAPFVATHRVPPPPSWGQAAFSHPDQPVVGVTWSEAVEYAGWLSVSFGGTWRLPTEAEWERAARGGLDQARTPWGDDVPAGEIPSGALAAPWLAGRGTPNGYGLLDPGTIVHEWCADLYAADFYLRSPRVDPRGPDAGERRSSRGGSWRHRVRWSTPAARSSLPPEFRYADYGFRLVRELS